MFDSSRIKVTLIATNARLEWTSASPAGPTADQGVGIDRVKEAASR
jgi:hypothetical protein